MIRFHVLTPLRLSLYIILFACSSVGSIVDKKNTPSQVISDLARSKGNETREETVFGKILYVWLCGMSFVSQHERSKLLALALSSLLGENCSPTVLEHFPHIMTMVVEALHDITKVDDMGYAFE